MLTALRDGIRIQAFEAERLGDYCCPDPACGAKLILKRGTVRIAHFAHESQSACALARESVEHMQAKFDLCAEYRRRGFMAEVEVPVCSPVENRRADLLVASPRNSSLRYAIEVQDAAVGEDELWRRTRSYSAASIRTIWISLVRPDRWSPTTSSDGALLQEKYSPRLHERWIERLAGEIWLYDPEVRQFWNARFREHLLHREAVNFINVGLGEHIDVAAHDLRSERWVDAVVTGPWKLDQIRISANPKRPIGSLIGQEREDN